MGDDEFWQKQFATRVEELRVLLRDGGGSTPEAQALRDALNFDWSMLLPHQREWAEPLLESIQWQTRKTRL